MKDHETALRELPRIQPSRSKESPKTVAERIRDLVHLHRGVIIEEDLHRSWWNHLCELSRSFPSGSLIFTGHQPPVDWPRFSHGRLIWYDKRGANKAREFTDHCRRFPHYNHGADGGLPYYFYIPYGTEDFEREQVFRAIESFRLNRNSLYSRPPSALNTVPLFPEQEPDPQIQYRTLEQIGRVIDHDQRYDHLGNFGRVRPLMIQCQSAVVLDNHCFNDQYSGYVSEKMLYPVAAGIPWIFAGNRYQRQAVVQRGFRPHLPMAETAQELIHQMLWLQAIFQDPQMSRRWQGRQGETVIHNQNCLRSLEQQITKEAQV